MMWATAAEGMIAKVVAVAATKGIGETAADEGVERAMEKAGETAVKVVTGAVTKATEATAVVKGGGVAKDKKTQPDHCHPLYTSIWPKEFVTN